MTRADFEREVSEATGESMSTVRNRGFNLVIVPEREPLTMDWDALQQVESIRRPLGRLSTKRLRLAA